MWHDGRIYFTEMGADRVSIIENGSTREFWHLPGCGPTQIVRFGSGFVVDCHLGRAMVEVSATGVTGRKFTTNRDGQPLQDPNAAVSDGQGGAYFSDAGQFDLYAPSTGRVYHLSAMGVMTEVVGQIKYANGVNFDPASRTLYVSEHLARRVLALTLDSRERVTARKVLIDFAQQDATRSFSFPLAGPDGIALRPGLLAVAEYGEGRVHLFDRDGRHRNTLKVSMPFVDTVIWDDSGNLYAGGAFQNTRPPFEGAVVRFPQSEWEKRP
jgi:sugar lactone lactonase YvrE